MNFISEPLHDMEQEIHRIWILVSELSDQLAQNNRIAAELHAQIQTLKVNSPRSLSWMRISENTNFE